MGRIITVDAAMAAAERAMLRPFAWGAADCCTAACGAFADLHGFDPMADWRGYRTAREALRNLGPDPVGTIRMTLERAGLTRGCAIGGFGLTEYDGRPSLLLCVGPDLWAGKTLNGLALLRASVMDYRIA
jgi:hypothetical protein